MAFPVMWAGVNRITPEIFLHLKTLAQRFIEKLFHKLQFSLPLTYIKK